jgi:alpha-ribazole phosphatase
MVPRVLWVARHAPVAVSGLCYGQSDVPTTLSTEDAAGVLVDVVTRASFGRIAEVWASPFARTEPVAAIVAAKTGARLRIDVRIAELSMGEWEGRDFDALERDDGARFGAWMAAWRSAAPPKGETLDGLVARVGAWARERARETPPGARLVVTHAGVIRALRALSANAPYEAELAKPVEHLALERVSLE